MPHENKPNFDIPPLTDVSYLLDVELAFLRYSTQKRNVAYLWQFLEFQIHLFHKYHTYGSVRKSMIRYIVLITANIIEYLLYISVRQKGQTPGHGLQAWINQAENLRLINSTLKGQLHDIRELRNRIHPNNQTEELDYNSFEDDQVDECVAHLSSLKESLKGHFQPNEVLTEPTPCPHQEYHRVLYSQGNVCPWCGEIIT